MPLYMAMLRKQDEVRLEIYEFKQDLNLFLNLYGPETEILETFQGETSTPFESLFIDLHSNFRVRLANKGRYLKINETAVDYDKNGFTIIYVPRELGRELSDMVHDYFKTHSTLDYDPNKDYENYTKIPIEIAVSQIPTLNEPIPEHEQIH